jgi:hypothetical protein
MQAAALQRNNAPLLLEPPQARRLLSRLPEIVTKFVARVATAKILPAGDALGDAREATRQLLVDGQITLTPRMPTSAVASYYSECTMEPNSPRLRSKNGHTGAA